MSANYPGDLSRGDRVRVYIPEGPGHRYDGALGTVVCRTPSQIGDYSVQLDGSRLQNWFYASELIKESERPVDMEAEV